MTIGATTPDNLNKDDKCTLPPAQSQDPTKWMISFGATMVPFVAFLYGHQRGLTVQVINAVVKSPLGPAGLLLLPFGTLAMEKCVYDTVQAAQGIDPNIVVDKKTRGGFPSGGAEAFPSFSLIPVQRQYGIGGNDTTQPHT